MATTETCICTCDGEPAATGLVGSGAHAVRAVDWARIAANARGTGLSIAGRTKDAAGDLGELTNVAVEKVREMGASATDTAEDLRAGAQDAAKVLRATATGKAKDLRKKTRGPLRDAVRMGTETAQKIDLAGAIPASVTDFVAEKTGRRRRRSAWVTAAWVMAGVAGAALGLAYVWRKFAASGATEAEMWDGHVDEHAEPAGRSRSYPATGSGSGWPEPQRAREHMEPVTRANGPYASRTNGGSAAAEPVAPEQDLAALSAAPAAGSPATAASPQAVMAEGSVAQQQWELQKESPEERRASMASDPADGRLAGATSAGQSPSAAFVERATARAESGSQPRADAMDRTMDLPRGMPAGRPEVPVGAAPAVPSEPPQRPEAPFTQEQAENNARLQLYQDAVLSAFPNMTRQEIVACDGDLDLLAGMIASGAGLTPEAARQRLDAVLGTSPAAQQPGE